ncbi:MAG: hypothetical protein HQK52_15575 [Oligoflexia bacterium]|nr:hypothetical protein [Oligoflexia bacterium]
MMRVSLCLVAIVSLITISFELISGEEQTSNASDFKRAINFWIKMDKQIVVKPPQKCSVSRPLPGASAITIENAGKEGQCMRPDVGNRFRLPAPPIPMAKVAPPLPPRPVVDEKKTIAQKAAEKSSFDSKSTDNLKKAYQELVDTEKRYLNQLLTLNYFFDELTHKNNLHSQKYSKLLIQLKHSLAILIEATISTKVFFEQINPETKSLKSITDAVNEFIYYDRVELCQAYNNYIALYEKYLTEFMKDTQLIKFLRSNTKEFALKNKDIDVNVEHFLGNHLITPVQRVPRYELLFREIMKYFPKDNTCSGHYHEYERVVDFFKQVGQDLKSSSCP